MLKLASVMHMKKNRVRGSLSLLLGTTIWGFSFIAQSVGMDHIGPFTFQAARCLLAVLFLIPCAFVLDIGKCSFRESAAKWKNPALWRVGLICGCALFVASSLQQIGIVYTDAGKAGFITAMYIVLVPVLGLFLGKKPSRTTVFSVALAVVGLYLLSCMGVSQINKGDLYLMGCALAQKFAPGTPFFHRLIIGYDVTDELFGITIARPGYLNPFYTYGAIALAAPAWAMGTALGIIAGNLLPVRVVSALSVALYGMFLAIIIPPARKSKVVAALVAISFALSFVCTYLPGISALSEGTRTILLTVAISGAAAVLFPVRQEENENDA